MGQRGPEHPAAKANRFRPPSQGRTKTRACDAYLSPLILIHYVLPLKSAQGDETLEQGTVDGSSDFLRLNKTVGM